MSIERRRRAIRKIELGELVRRAGLDHETDGDLDAILGALSEIAEKLKGADRTQLLARWRRRGQLIGSDVADGEDDA